MVSDKKKADKELLVLSELNEANEASLQQIESEYQIVEKFLLTDVFNLSVGAGSQLRDASGAITTEKLR